MGGVDIADRFSKLPFDHLFFTGSTRVGRMVMSAASANLTPVTLELGGKSPVVLSRNYDMKKAARTIAIGKLFNAGQSCVAPDYVLVPEELVQTFADEFLKASVDLYPRIAGNPDYTSIISDQHFKRLVDLVEDAREGGARVLQHPDQSGVRERRMAPTVLLDAALDSLAMRDEIFGPVLPILGYRDIAQAIALVNERPKPLALYCFSRNDAEVKHVLEGTRSGGVTINGTLLHATQEDLPFGGVGESGTGGYHGRAGFLRLSHARGVMHVSRLNMADKFAAPYGKLTNLATRIFLGK